MVYEPESDSPFDQQMRLWIEQREPACWYVAERWLREELPQIARIKLDTPAYADDKRMARFAEALERGLAT